MATTNLPSIDYTARDFSTLKQSLLAHVQAFFPNDFQDFLESNLGVMILDVVAYVGDNLSFYLDHQANECFLVTAQERSNVVNLARQLGYTPRTASAASLNIRAQLPAQTAATIIPSFARLLDRDGTVFEFLEPVEIAAGRTDTYQQVVTLLSLSDVPELGDGVSTEYAFTAKNYPIVPGTLQVQYTIGGMVYTSTFGTDGQATLVLGGSGVADYATGVISLLFVSGSVPDSGTNLILGYTFNQNIVAYQGETVLDVFSSDGTANQEITLTQSPVLVRSNVSTIGVTPDPARFEVWLGDPSPPFGESEGIQWTRVDSLVEAGPTDEVYSVRIDGDDTVTVQFGDSVSGRIPPLGTSNISVVYRVGGGVAGNISSGFLNTTTVGIAAGVSVNVDVTNYEPGTGGAARESVDEIRANAPRLLRTNDTATTEEDITALADTFSDPGLGTIAFAKARLTPNVTFQALVRHQDLVLGTVPDVVDSLRRLFYFELPGTPIVMTTGLQPVLSYTIGTTPTTDTAEVVSAGQTAKFADANIDGTETLFRTDEQSHEDESLYVGNGSVTVFSGQSLDAPPILPRSVLLAFSVGGNDVVAYDDGAGNIVGSQIASGTINYETGAVDLTTTTAPDNATSILAQYTSALRLVFSDGQEPDVNTDISITGYVGPTTKELPTNNIEIYTWARDAQGRLTRPSTALRDSLKAYLDLRRVVGTSLEVLAGFNVKVNLYLNVMYNTAASVTSTNARILEALEDFFASSVQVAPGQDVTLAGIYDVLYPLFGVDSIVVQDVGLRVPIGTGVGTVGRYRSGNLPGTYVSLGKLPAVLAPQGMPGNVKLYRAAAAEIATSTRITASGSDGVVSSASANGYAQFDSASVSDWTSVAATGDTLVIGAGGTNAGTFSVISVAAGQIWVSGVLSNDTGEPWQIVTQGPVVSFTGSGVSGNSTMNLQTGTFDFRLATPLLLNEPLEVEYLLDEETSAEGIGLWNVEITPWEIGVLGGVFVNGFRIN